MTIESAVSTSSTKRASGHGAPLIVIRTGAEGQPALQVTTTANYNWIYNDTGSGSHRDVTIYRPHPADDSYSIIGDYAQDNYAPAVGASYVVRAINDNPNFPLLKAPVDFRQVWNDKGSGGDHDGSVWYPVPPDGYITLGFVGQGGYGKPSIPNFRCLRRDLIMQADVGPSVWSDAGSGAHEDVALYPVIGLPNVFLAQANYNPFTGTGYKLKPA